MSHLFDFLFPLMLFGPMLVTSLYGVHTLQSGSYQQKSTRSEMVFLRPVALVVFGVTIALNLLVMMALIDDKALFNELNWQYVSTHPDAAKIVLAFGAVAFILYWSIIRWYVKTCALVLNLDRRTYRTIDFAHVPLKERTGSWDDIEGISIRCASAKGNVIFYVHLKWRGASKLASSLGGFSKRDRAEAFAAQTARELGLPFVAP